MESLKEISDIIRSSVRLSSNHIKNSHVGKKITNNRGIKRKVGLKMALVGGKIR
jgi:hypothetical protein